MSACLMTTPLTAEGQVPKANQDEALVTMSPLPDPLVGVDGTRITDAKQWPAQRERLLKLIGENEFPTRWKSRCELGHR